MERLDFDPLFRWFVGLGVAAYNLVRLPKLMAGTP